MKLANLIRRSGVHRHRTGGQTLLVEPSHVAGIA